MEEKKTTQQSQIELTNSNIIFGTSSDDIQQGLHNQQFIDSTEQPEIDDKDLIVNEEVQNEIVNPSEETFNEELAPATVPTGVTSENEAQEKNSSDPDDDNVDHDRNISKAED